jgi:UDP-N-acetyl-D-glucosamine dehydrogenase
VNSVVAKQAAWAADRCNVGVIGLGIVGSITARVAAEAGHRVLGFDIDAERVAALAAAFDNSSVTAAVDSSVLHEADVIVIAVRAPVNQEGVVDLRAVISAVRIIEELASRPRLVLIETTLPPGTTRKLATGLSSDVSARTQVAHCPERLRVGDTIDNVRRVPRLVGGLTDEATALGVQFLQDVGIPAVPVSGPEVAELAKLLENGFLTTGIALLGEITRISHRLGISAAEVADAAETKPDGYFPFRPGPAIGGHCLINDLRMLRKTAADLGVDAPLLAGVQEAAEELNANVLARLKSLLRRHDQQLDGACIWLVGIGFKVGSSDTSGSPAIDLTRQLRRCGCKVVFSDSRVRAFEVDGVDVVRAAVQTQEFRSAAALIVSGDPDIEINVVRERAAVVLDLGGARVMSGDQSILERL